MVAFQIPNDGRLDVELPSLSLSEVEVDVQSGFGSSIVVVFGVGHILMTPSQTIYGNPFDGARCSLVSAE